MTKDKARPIEIYVEGNEPEFPINFDDDTPRTLFVGSIHDKRTLDIHPTKQLKIINEIHQKIDTELGRVDGLNDDRLLAIISALLIENAFEEFLKAVFPGFKELSKKSELTFSMKIEIAKALHYMPFKIINNADFIREIRNKFAHNLEFESFDSMDVKIIQGLKDRAKSYSPSICAREKLSDIFKEFTYCTASAIYYFTIAAKFHSEFIRSEEEFHSPFQEFLHKKYGV